MFLGDATGRRLEGLPGDDAKVVRRPLLVRQSGESLQRFAVGRLEGQPDINHGDLAVRSLGQGQGCARGTWPRPDDQGGSHGISIMNGATVVTAPRPAHIFPRGRLGFI
jgi:hypothetical protein